METKSSLVDILILTAVETEYTAVRKHVSNLRKVEGTNTSNHYEVGEFMRKKIAIRRTGQGNSRMAAEAVYAINHFCPQMVILVGIAGGINQQKVKIGDVVVVTRVYAYEVGKETGEGFLSREHGGTMDKHLLEKAIPLIRQKEWQAMTSHKSHEYKAIDGPIASGESLITFSDSDKIKLIKKNSEDALAVEMEGLGFLEALNSFKAVKGINIRGISDLLDGKDKNYNNGDRELAAENASAFAFHLIRHLKLPPRPQQILEEQEEGFDIKREIKNINTETYNEINNHTNSNADNYINNSGVINIHGKKNFQSD